MEINAFTKVCICVVLFEDADRVKMHKILKRGLAG